MLMNSKMVREKDPKFQKKNHKKSMNFKCPKFQKSSRKNVHEFENGSWKRIPFLKKVCTSQTSEKFKKKCSWIKKRFVNFKCFELQKKLRNNAHDCENG